MYEHTVVGGTFDGLHKGHQKFLTAAFDVSRHVTIGLTSEAYIRRFKKDKGPVTPYSKRYQALTRWLRREGYAFRASILPLDNRWGPAILGDGFDAIAVTADNKHVATDINSVRTSRGLPALSVVDVPIVRADDRQAISSTRVREGVIDRNGHLVMPDSMRLELQKPLGSLITGEAVRRTLQKNKDNILITVGDVATQSLFLLGYRPALAVIDLRVERKPFRTLASYKFPKAYEMVHVKSGPGFISHAAVDAIISWSKGVRQRKRIVLVVEGEEDLLTLPVIVHAPLRSVAFYGQPPSAGKEGLVEVVVTPRAKQAAEKLLARFT